MAQKSFNSFEATVAVGPSKRFKLNLFQVVVDTHCNKTLLFTMLCAPAQNADICSVL